MTKLDDNYVLYMQGLQYELSTYPSRGNCANNSLLEIIQTADYTATTRPHDLQQ